MPQNIDGFVKSRHSGLPMRRNDPIWADRSESTLEKYAHYTTLYINSIIYSEISIGFELIKDKVSKS